MSELNHEDFLYISNRVYKYCKIYLSEKKKPLIITRLRSRLKLLGLDSIKSYVRYLKSDDEGGIEFSNMVDSLSTNYSHFFREMDHFEFLNESIIPGFIEDNKTLNIWSAASSNGQEIYSVLLTILEYLDTHKVTLNYKLYASDISKKVLKKATNGVYSIDDVRHIEDPVLHKYFLEGVGKMEGYVKLKKEFIRKVDFFWVNLNEIKNDIPKMDIIFLRNVIIYFDKESIIEIVSRLIKFLKVGGYLIVGHSESLTGINPELRHIGRSIYIKESI